MSPDLQIKAFQIALRGFLFYKELVSTLEGEYDPEAGKDSEGVPGKVSTREEGDNAESPDGKPENISEESSKPVSEQTDDVVMANMVLLRIGPHLCGFFLCPCCLR